jgi:hypothetical protein
MPPLLPLLLLLLLPAAARREEALWRLGLVLGATLRAATAPPPGHLLLREVVVVVVVVGECMWETRCRLRLHHRPPTPVLEAAVEAVSVVVAVAAVMVKHMTAAAVVGASRKCLTGLREKTRTRPFHHHLMTTVVAVVEAAQAVI